MIAIKDAKLMEAQKQAFDDTHRILNAIVAEEKRLLETRQIDQRRYETLSWFALTAQGLVALVLLWLLKAALTTYEREYATHINALKASRDEAIAAREAAEDALAAKSLFLSTVSHEVRTPLAGVIGFVELICVNAEGDLANLGKAAFESCKRLLQILNDLLDASKLQAGEVRLEYRWFSVRPVIGDIVQLISPVAQEKNLEIISHVAPEVPDTLYGDELRVRQILKNLAFNAVKFTTSGSVGLTVKLVSKDRDCTVLDFLVEDTGIGISAEQQEQIFEPFVQSENSTTKVYGGTGLGLSICRNLLALMGGQIKVVSQSGKGSVFTVTIPFRNDVPEAPEIPNT